MFSCDPNVELNGHTVQAFLQSAMHSNYEHILEKHGFDQIDPDVWYPLQDVLSVIREISQHSNAMMSLVSIGIAAAENSLYPPEIERLSVSEFFHVYGDYYPKRHRGGDPGWVDVEKPADDHLVISFQVPYPDDLFYGIIYGYVRRFSEPGELFSVVYDDEALPRDKGGDYTVVHVYWD